MALINCPDCGNNVSDQAEVCRHCGRPIKNQVNMRIHPEEIEIDLFNPHEAEMLRRRVIENENSLNGVHSELEKEEKRKKKQREDLLKNIKQWAILVIGVTLLFFIRRKFF